MVFIKEGIVSGTEVAPVQDAEKYAEFMARTDHALAIIVLAIDHSLLILLESWKIQLLFGRNWQTSFRKKPWKINLNCDIALLSPIV